MTDIKTLIITGGDVDVNFPCKDTYQLIIAVDGGLEKADEMGIRPDVILGDFDTVSPSVLKKYEGKNSKIIRLNPMKDDTDTQAAINYAMEQGAKKIDLLGATGSRFDHSLANIFVMKMAMEQGVEITAYTPLSKIYLIRGSKSYKPGDFYGKYLSFLQFDGPAFGVTLEGFAYPLENFDFDTRKTYRLGVSNEASGGPARVVVREGVLLAIESKEDK